MAKRLSDIQPGEVSLVHRGANRRRFLLAKADGELDADIAEVLAAPATHEALLLDAVRKAGGDESVEKAAAAFARVSAALTDAYGDEMPDAVLKAMRRQMDAEDAEDTLDNGADEKDEHEGAEDMLEKASADAEHAIYKRDFSAEQRRTLAAKGHALPNGSYPIESAADLGPAVTLADSGHGDTTAAKALIKRRAKALGATSALPESWNVNKEDRMSETAQAVPVKKEDGSWDLSAVPEDSRAAVEAVLKAHDTEVAELRKAAEAEASKAENAERIAKAVQEKIAKAEYVAKSHTYDNLAKSDDEFGELLYTIAKAEEDKHLPEGTLDNLDAVLKAANEAASAVYVEVGRTGGYGKGDAETKVEGIAKALREAEPKLTREQAFAKALEQNPDLYSEIRKEQA